MVFAHTLSLSVTDPYGLGGRAGGNPRGDPSPLEVSVRLELPPRTPDSAGLPACTQSRRPPKTLLVSTPETRGGSMTDGDPRVPGFTTSCRSRVVPEGSVPLLCRPVQTPTGRVGSPDRTRGTPLRPCVTRDLPPETAAGTLLGSFGRTSRPRCPVPSSESTRSFDHDPGGRPALPRRRVVPYRHVHLEEQD